MKKNTSLAVIIPIIHSLVGGNLGNAQDITTRISTDSKNNETIQTIIADNKTIVATEKNNSSELYGIETVIDGWNLNYSFFQDNVGKQQRLRLKRNLVGGWGGFEVQDADKDKLSVLVGFNINKNTDIELIVDSYGKVRGALFYQINENTLCGIGGGEDYAHGSAINLGFSHKFRSGHGVFIDAHNFSDNVEAYRLRFGKNILVSKTKAALTVDAPGFNTLSDVAEGTVKLSTGRANLNNPEFLVGDEKGDIGFDAKYLKGNSAYASTALCLGNGIKLIGGIEYDLKNNRQAIVKGIGFNLRKNTPINFYHLNNGEKRVFVQHQRRF